MARINSGQSNSLESDSVTASLGGCVSHQYFGADAAPKY